MKGKSKQNLDTKEGDNDKTVHRVMCIIMDEIIIIRYLILTARTNPSPTNSAPSFIALSASIDLILFTLYPDDHIVI